SIYFAIVNFSKVDELKKKIDDIHDGALKKIDECHEKHVGEEAHVLMLRV
uniref:Uncharacterized protein n=1 Tax=Amphimedon queenslandica TaxID=400682 RepID=A0A1X7U380_AMPQE